MAVFWKPQSAEWFRKKFRDDYQFAMIVLFGAIAAFVVFGFAIYRYLAGYYIGGTVDLLIVISVLLVLFYTVYTGRTRRAGMIFAVVTVIACIASTAAFGRTGILWGYVVFWVNFLLTGRRFALFANLVLMAVLVIETSLFQSILEGASYIVTALLVTACGYIFAERLVRYQSQLETLALEDPLTRAGNRRRMRQDLTAAISAHRRNGTPYTLALLDLDHFKVINDEFGHETGDRILRDFSDLVRKQIREEDGFYRFGGEEFVLLLTDHGAQHASDAVESLHKRISGKLAYDRCVVRFSAGVAVLGEGEDWPAWLTRADTAMYQAKSAGRNQVVLANERSVTGTTQITPKTSRLRESDN